MTDPSTPIQVAVCEDNDALRDILTSVLPKFGLRVFGVASAEALDRLLGERDMDIVVLDIGLPGEDGLSACARLRRERPNLGIVMLTARALLDDRIRGMNQGADLYFVKPVDMAELAASISSLHRRVVQLKTRPQQPWKLARGRGVLEAPTGVAIDLSENECLILSRLLQEPGVPVDREDLLHALAWPSDSKVYQRLASIVSRLRAKVVLAAPEDAFPLRTIHGTGYVFRMDEDPQP